MLCEIARELSADELSRIEALEQDLGLTIVAFSCRSLDPEREERLHRITQVLGVHSGQIEHLVSRTNLLPAPVVGHEKLVAEIDRHLEGKKLLLTGNYFTGLAIEDCVSRSAAEAARLEALL